MFSLAVSSISKKEEVLVLLCMNIAVKYEDFGQSPEFIYIRHFRILNEWKKRCFLFKAVFKLLLLNHSSQCTYP